MVIVVSLALAESSSGVKLRAALLPFQYPPRPRIWLSSSLLSSVLENIWYLEAGDRLCGYVNSLLPPWLDLIRLASRSLEPSASHSSDLFRFFNSSGPMGVNSVVGAAWLVFLRWFSAALRLSVLALLRAVRSSSNLRLYMLKNLTGVVIIKTQEISEWE